MVWCTVTGVPRIIELTLGTCSVLIPCVAEVELISIMFGMVDPLGPTAGVPWVVDVRGRGAFNCTSIND